MGGRGGGGGHHRHHHQNQQQLSSEIYVPGEASCSAAATADEEDGNEAAVAVSGGGGTAAADSADSGSDFGLTPNDKTWLLVRKIPPKLNEISIIDKHFSKFGKVVNIKVRGFFVLLQNSA